MGCGNSSSVQVHPHVNEPQNQNTKNNDGNNLNIYPSTNSIEDWKALIKTLLNNKTLEGYVESRKRTSFQNMDELKNFLMKAPAKNATEKAWCIYLWVTQNIDYDFAAFIQGTIGPQDSFTVFRTGKSVCAGYSNLSKDLFDACNIPAIKICGYAKGYGYKIGQKIKQTDHDWNAIFIDNKWRFIETTWGAGYGDPSKGFVRKFKPHYFFTPPEIFIYKHLPEKPEFQYLSKPITLADYEIMPAYDLNFFLNGFKCLTNFKALIEPDGNKFKMEFQAPENVKMIGHQEMVNKTRIENAVFIQRDYRTNKIIVEVSIQSNEQSSLNLFGGDGNNKSYDGICDFAIKPKKSTKGPLYCQTFSFPKEIYLFEPKENSLKIGQEYLFKVFVNAFDVTLITSKNDWIYLKKSEEGDNIWMLKYTPETEGDLKLSAKVNTENTYSTAYVYSVKK